MKIFPPLICIAFLCNISALDAQYPGHGLPQYPESWECRWITHPDIDNNAHNLIHFRNTFELQERPDQFIVHVSGDNRYRLHVNGREVCYGPQLADIRHWRYETVDLASFLKEGKNVVAVEVMNWGTDRSYGIISLKTGFMLQGHSEKEAFLSTDFGSSWKVFHNRGMHEKSVDWIFGGEIVGGFYASNPMDSVVATDYPWGWKEADFDDSGWKNPEVYLIERPNTSGGGHGWLMQPRTTSIQTSEKEPPGDIIRTKPENFARDFNFGDRPLVIPPNSDRTLLIDRGYVTLGYPELHLSGGKGACIRVRYSEALYDENNHKGNRDVTEGKVIRGISDVYVMDGGENRIFKPMWFRTFRFVRLDIETREEALKIDDFYNMFSASPIPVTAEFNTRDPVYREVWDICRHGLEICAQDNLLSDAYYEQMQYVGDLRPHLKAWTSLTGDLTYFRSAMEQFNNSRLPDGNITSCYPLKATFVHPTYSLIWIDMLHDLMMTAGERELIGSCLGEIQEVFDYYESLINENGLVGDSEYPMFIDWYLPKGGNSPVNRNGNSAILTLGYAYTLNNAAGILEWLGYREKAGYYRAQSRKYAEIVRSLCFDPEKGIYADDPEKTFYDQRAGIMAVLAGAHTESEERILMDKILDEETGFDSKANLFFYFYLFEAMAKTGVGNFTRALGPWKELVEMGMSATPEKRIEQHPRSEVHPWTAHPVHYYFRVVAGIGPATPGFKTVRIAPQPGQLEFIHATYPTIHGNILIDLTFGKNKEVEGEIILPGKMTGEFIWLGKAIKLQPGRNDLFDRPGRL